MTTVLEAIQAQIAAAPAALDSVAFLTKAPDDQAPPYAVYARVGGQPQNTLADGAPLTRYRIQVSAYADTQTAADALLAQMATVLTGSVLAGVAIGAPVDGYEEPTRLYLSMQDFSLFY